jgi:hypothetical protein
MSQSLPSLRRLTRLVEEMDHFVVMFNRYRAHLEKLEHELQAAVRLQAAAREFLVRHTIRKMRAAINTAPSTIPSIASLGVAATHYPVGADDGYGCANKQQTFTKILQA